MRGRITEPVHWFAFIDHRGRRWTVAFATSEMSPHLADEDGERYAATVFRPRQVLVHVHYHPRTYADSLWHEFGHVALVKAPESEALLRNYRAGDARRTDLAWALQEEHVEHASRGLRCVATQLGARLPPIPAAALLLREQWRADRKRRRRRKSRAKEGS